MTTSWLSPGMMMRSFSTERLESPLEMVSCLLLDIMIIIIIIIITIIIIIVVIIIIIIITCACASSGARC